MSVVTLAPDFSDGDQLVATRKIAIPGDDHPAGYTFSDVTTIWKQGQLIGGTGIKVPIYAYEEDSGDPDEVASAIKEYLQDKAKQGSAAIANAYAAGADATSIANSPELQWFVTVLSLGLAGWVGDDEVGFGSVEVPLSEIKTLSRMTQAEFEASLTIGPDNMKYNRKVEIRGDGRYTVYFRVSAAAIASTPYPPNPPHP